jgi:hypothetical protein
MFELVSIGARREHEADQVYFSSYHRAWILGATLNLCFSSNLALTTLLSEIYHIVYPL